MGEMHKQSLEPNTITYSAAISACEKGQLPERALELLADMHKQSLEPNSITYSAAISACEKGSCRSERSSSWWTCTSKVSSPIQSRTAPQSPRARRGSCRSE